MTANERMQKNFNDFIFKLEQKEYGEQGIEWSFVDFPDNGRVLELIEVRNGVLKARRRRVPHAQRRRHEALEQARAPVRGPRALAADATRVRGE